MKSFRIRVVEQTAPFRDYLSGYFPTRREACVAMRTKKAGPDFKGCKLTVVRT